MASAGALAARPLSVPASSSSSPSPADPRTKPGSTPRLVDLASDAFTTALKGPGTAGTSEVAAVARTPSGDAQYDGHLIGPDGTTHPPGTPLNQVAPGNGPVIIEVNGINTNVAGHRQEMAALQAQTGGQVVGLHNATQGLGNDLLQAAQDWAGFGNNPAVQSLKQTILAQLAAGQPIHLVGYSQGALIVARALELVRDTLIQQHTGAVQAAHPDWTPQQVQAEATRLAEQQMHNIQVETFGGAGSNYPNGPQYVHYVNTNDPVARFLGLGTGPGVPPGAGAGAQVHYFSAGNFWNAHDFGLYMQHRVPFAQAQQGNFQR